jgi:uncharacterized membrane protein
MTTAINKKLAFIPTELNAFAYLKNKQIKQGKTINSTSKWLVILLIWNVLITGFLIYDRIEHLTPELEAITNYELLED